MSHTLLLNKDYNPISVLPLSVINWQHSIKLMFFRSYSDTRNIQRLACTQ